MRGIIIALLILVLVPLASAVSTDIHVKTLPIHDVFVSIIEPTGEGEYLQILKGKTDYRGEITLTFTNDEHTSFKIALLVKRGEVIAFPLKKFDETYQAGGIIELEMLPDGYVDPFAEECDAEHLSLCENEADCSTASGFWYDNICNSEECNFAHLELCMSEATCSTAGGFFYNNVCNSEEQNETEESNETEENTSTLTGFFVFGDSGEDKPFFSSKILWGVIVLVVISIVAIFIKRKMSPAYGKKPTHPHNAIILEHELTQTERKLRYAQEEINRLKNKDKIEATRKKIESEKEELRKMERGEI